MFIKEIELLEASSLYKTNTIRDAFEKLNGNFGMVITVVDNDSSFCGIVTDGDLRRFILNSYSLDHPLELVMNKNPVTIHQDDLKDNNNFDYLQ